MNQELLRLVDKIKSTVRDLDDEGISHPLIDKLYDQLTEMEDIIYEEEERGDEDDQMFYD
jgi:hypothetical protein